MVEIGTPDVIAKFLEDLGALVNKYSLNVRTSTDKSAE